MMNAKGTKKSQRAENKKRKLAALLALAEQDILGETNNQDDSGNDKEFEYDESCMKFGVDEDEGSVLYDECHNSSRKRKFSNNLKDRYRELVKRQKSCESPGIDIDTVFLANKERKILYLKENAPLKAGCVHVFPSDIQNFLNFLCLGRSSFYRPRWCNIKYNSNISQVVMLTVEHVSYNDVCISRPSSWRHTNSIFTSKNTIPVVSPELTEACIEIDLFMVPLPPVLVARQKNVKRACDQLDDVSDTTSISAECSFHMDIETHTDIFPRTLLLLPISTLIQENFPIPVNENFSGDYSDFVFSKQFYTKVTDSSPLFAVDCEMVVTEHQELELASICVVNEKLQVVYNTLVKPTYKITDYLTKFSGMTAELLNPVTKCLKDVQKELSDILPSDAILCGQSLNSDMSALKMFHPYVVDTSLIYNLSGESFRKASLQRLASRFLRKDIQTGSEGHCPMEDAITTMELVLLKLQLGYKFGNVALDGSTETPAKYFKSAVEILKSKTPVLNGANIHAVEMSNIDGDIKDDYQTSTSADLSRESKKSDTGNTISAIDNSDNVHQRQGQLVGKETYNNHSDTEKTDNKIIQPLEAFSRKTIPQLESNFFDLLASNQKNVLVCCEKHLPMIDSEIICHRSAKSDKKKVHIVKKEGVKQHKDFIYVQLNSKVFTKSEKIFRKTDRYISDIWDELAPQSLCLVFFTGTKSEQGCLKYAIKPNHQDLSTSQSESADPYDSYYGSV